MNKSKKENKTNMLCGKNTSSYQADGRQMPGDEPPTVFSSRRTGPYQTRHCSQNRSL